MATRNQVSYGSKGDDVRELQTILNNNGYNLSVDGIFGAKTQAAVKDYQRKNGLSVDGIVGVNTWGALTKASAATSNPGQTATGTQATPAPSPTYEYKPYQESDTVKQAQAMLQQHMQNKPGEYQSQWQDQLNAIMDKIMNREDFTYDLNGDALYQQYKDQYSRQGKMAMLDTIGQASAMTGGFGNSYAQSVGQQTYQGYLQQLNDRVPELYQLALDKYNQEGQDLYNQFSMLGDRESQDYSRYRDQMSDYYTNLDYLTGRYDSEREYDYNRYADDRDFSYGQYADDRAYAYQQERDKVADEQWQAEFDEAKRQYDQSYALSASKSSGGSSGSSSRNKPNGGTSYDTHGYTKEQIKEIQRSAGITADGIWGPKTQAAYDAGYRPDSSGGTTIDEKGMYADWGKSDWQGYFNSIRVSEGVEAANKELRRMTAAGLIPKQMIQYCATGARGTLGH